ALALKNLLAGDVKGGEFLRLLAERVEGIADVERRGVGGGGVGHQVRLGETDSCTDDVDARQRTGGAGAFRPQHRQCVGQGQLVALDGGAYSCVERYRGGGHRCDRRVRRRIDGDDVADEEIGGTVEGHQEIGVEPGECADRVAGLGIVEGGEGGFVGCADQRLIQDGGAVEFGDDRGSVGVGTGDRDGASRIDTLEYQGKPADLARDPSDISIG